MAREDRIESFVRKLFIQGKNRRSKQEILAAFDRNDDVRNIEGMRAMLARLPEHEYDEIALTNALASMLARGHA